MDSTGLDTLLGDMTFQETSNIPHLSSNDTTIVSFTEENILMNLTSLQECANRIVDAMLFIWHLGILRF